MQIADEHAGPDSQTAQIVRQPVGPRVQLAVGQLLILKDHRHGFRRPPHLRLEQLVNATVRRISPHRVVPLHQHLMPLVFRQQR